MPFNILSDNWTLQEIANLYIQGLSIKTAQRIKLKRNKNEHSYKPISEAGIQIQTLLNFLVEVVLCDKIILDPAFSNTWKDNANQLNDLEKNNLILYKTFNAQDELFEYERNQILKMFKLPGSLSQMMEENIKAWEKYRKVIHSHESSLIWGTAGNLNRSNREKSPYSPHPYRKYFLEQSGFRLKRTGLDFIDKIKTDIRAKLTQRIEQKFDLTILNLNLHPIAIEIIESSNSIEDLIKVAIQMRSKYRKLRSYLSKYQTAIENNDLGVLNEYRKTIDSVEEGILKNKERKYGETEISLPFWSLSIPLPIPNGIIPKFGIEVILQKLILKKSSENTVKKLLQLFDERNPIVIENVINHFRK